MNQKPLGRIGLALIVAPAVLPLVFVLLKVASNWERYFRWGFGEKLIFIEIPMFLYIHYLYFFIAGALTLLVLSRNWPFWSDRAMAAAFIAGSCLGLAAVLFIMREIDVSTLLGAGHAALLAFLCGIVGLLDALIFCYLAGLPHRLAR